MYPKYHIIINFFISLPLLFFLKPVYVLVFFFSSFLIDADHYLYYIIEERRIRPIKAYRWFKMKDIAWRKLSIEERRKHGRAILIFHGLEILALFSLLSTIYYPFLFITLGIFVHMIEDLIEEIPLGIAERKLSLIYSIYIYKTLKKF